ncbi:helix-turn-helix transcriptional regulator [Primorskyibacter sp. S87]|uniref:helix-turn-helix transcriptional regulator n=1 Tax=Primorskyibacter sp. S87 TaxID=3415126 RepID=UPI003C79997C
MPEPKYMSPEGADLPDYNDGTHAAWQALDVNARAELLLQGVPFPSETATETRCRLKRDLSLYDDDDLAALLDKSHDTLARMRVKGTGPVPIRVAREIFYDRDDVHAWIKRHRDSVKGEAA